MSTFMLSPGDEIRVTVLGHSEFDRTLRIDPDGVITFPLVGDIVAGGMSVPDLRMALAEGLESAEEQRIGSGDEVQVKVFRHEDLDVLTRIPSSGRVNLPLAGEVAVAGLTAEEANRVIGEKLSAYLRNPSVRTTILESGVPSRVLDPQVSIEILRFAGQKVVVLGAVTNPGIYLSEGDTRLLDILALAGGPTVHAKLQTVAILRPATADLPPQGVLVDLRRTIEEGDLSQNYLVRRGDVVFLPNRRIADAAQFFTYLNEIVMPIVRIGTGVWLGQNIEAGPRRSGQSTIVFQ